ncbi:MAG: aa3-type cytochrome c oxidase subunit IV [Proteobacteria bacterium]|nr:aa3-type cytochrome c oxidase subunit IV [Pseudomonadota bacterium]
MADHTPGKMDIREHEKTFDGFIKVTTWSAVVCIVVLIFLALANA